MTYQNTETLVFWTTDLMAIVLRAFIMAAIDLAIWLVPTVARGISDAGWLVWLVLRLCVRLIVAAGMVLYRRWKYRHIKAERYTGDDFIYVEWEGVTI